MTAILARVTTPDPSDRGADGALRIEIPRSWVVIGRSIQIELPRNIVCARCGGGGCSACELSGAITLRGRDDPAELVVVNFSSRSTASLGPEATSQAAFTVRIPGQAGLPRPGAMRSPRGTLYVTVVCANAASPGVELVEPEVCGELCQVEDSSAIATQAWRDGGMWLISSQQGQRTLVGLILVVVLGALVGLIY